MGQALKIVLVIAALFGLFGQTVAVVANPTATSIEATAPATMPMDCLGMMQGTDGKPTPCDKMTFACIAGMGCFTPFTFEGGQAIADKAMMAVTAPTWPSTPALEGRSIQPEPHPPAPLV